MPRSGGAQWDDSNQRLMLLAIIHLSAPATPNWDEVAALMGNTFTGNAIRQQYNKLRAGAKQQFGEDGGTTTPKKATTKGTPGSTAKKRKGTKETSKAAESDDKGEGVAAEDDEESPTKKVKTEQQDNFV